MFTGIIEETGKIEAVRRLSAGARLIIRGKKIFSDLKIGASVAVNGCCLTAVEIAENAFAADLSPETLEKTNLGDLQPGAAVNLERPLAANGRLDGHIVQGHVDATGAFLGVEPAGDGNWTLRVRAPRELLKFFVYKGSVAIDGISLTVAKLVDDVIEVAIIPHTYEETNLRFRNPGDRVNLECDVIAKHVARLLERIDAPQRGLDLNELRDEGF